jgi:hypothetical protein
MEFPLQLNWMTFPFIWWLLGDSIQYISEFTKVPFEIIEYTLIHSGIPFNPLKHHRSLGFIWIKQWHSIQNWMELPLKLNWMTFPYILHWYIVGFHSIPLKYQRSLGFIWINQWHSIQYWMELPLKLNWMTFPYILHWYIVGFHSIPLKYQRILRFLWINQLDSIQYTLIQWFQ